jgi:NAD(P)-dependent dehydrogenase (short-subunit alcohol dehydrogenase family)
MQVLVAGGTGLVGAAIVRALAASHAVSRLVVTSRSHERLATLIRGLVTQVAEIIPLVVDPDVMSDGAALHRELVRAVSSVDAAIASLGAGEPDGRRFSALSRAEFDATMGEMLGAHVAFASATLPLLSDDGIYIGIGGGAAFAPMRGGGAVSIAAAAQAMMTRVLAAENERPGVRIRELIIDASVVPYELPERRGTIAPEEVGAVVEELVRSGSTSRARIETTGPMIRMRPLD